MLNKEVITSLTDSKFCERFLNFVQRYEKFKHENILESADVWVRDENYEYIKAFLNISPIEEIIPFSLTDFARMDEIQMSAWHDYCIELKHLLDEKNALYQELNNYI